LSETQFGLLVGAPVLTGSLIRVMLGVRAGGRLVFTATMLNAAVAAFPLSYAHTFPQILIAALGVGWRRGDRRGARRVTAPHVPPPPVLLLPARRSSPSVQSPAPMDFFFL
jgi:NNP family nitrate/nitrite transporter-like MFS transporter